MFSISHLSRFTARGTFTRPLIIPLRFLLCLFLAVSLAERSYGEEVKELLTYTDSDVTLSLLADPSSTLKEMSIKVSGARHTRSSVFLVEDPARLVIDLFGIKISKNRTFNFENGIEPTSNALLPISALRLGSHEDKLRIVLNLTSEAPPEYSWSENETGSILKILRAGSAVGLDDVSAAEVSRTKPPTPASPTPKLTTSTPTAVAVIVGATILPVITHPPASPTPSISSTGTPSSSPSAAATVTRPHSTSAPTQASTATPLMPTVTPSLVPSQISTATRSPTHSPTRLPSFSPTHQQEEPTPAPTATPSPEPAIAPITTDKSGSGSANTIQQIIFERSPENNSPLLRLVLPRRMLYQVSRQGDKLYRLAFLETVGDAPEHLTHPFYPPQDFAGFTHVQVKKVSGKGIEIEIGVDHGARLTALPRESEIWIQVQKVDSESVESRGE